MSSIPLAVPSWFDRRGIYAGALATGVVLPDVAPFMAVSCVLAEVFARVVQVAVYPHPVGFPFRFGTPTSRRRRSRGDSSPEPREPRRVRAVVGSDGRFLSETILPDLVASGLGVVHVQEGPLDVAPLRAAARRAGREDDLFVVDLTGEGPVGSVVDVVSAIDDLLTHAENDPTTHVSSETTNVLRILASIQRDLPRYRGTHPLALMDAVAKGEIEAAEMPGDVTLLLPMSFRYRPARGADQPASFVEGWARSRRSVADLVERIGKPFDPDASGFDASLQDILDGRRILVVRVPGDHVFVEASPASLILRAVASRIRRDAATGRIAHVVSLLDVGIPMGETRKRLLEDAHLLLSTTGTPYHSSAYGMARDLPMQSFHDVIVEAGASIGSAVAPGIGRKATKALPHGCVLHVSEDGHAILRRPAPAAPIMEKTS